MIKFNNVTFTGIDEFTDIDRLQSIQQKYPNTEFGILFSMDYKENGNRYPNPEILNKLVGKGLHLSAHLCGKLARECYKGNWSILNSLIPNLNNTEINELFDRIQLNLVGTVFSDRISIESCPLSISSIIIQQKSAVECDLYKLNDKIPTITMLCDPSGGRGIDSEIIAYNSPYEYIGYAGGIGEDNLISKLEKLEEVSQYYYWIDMESKVRTNDKFDLDIVERILLKLHNWTSDKVRGADE